MKLPSGKTKATSAVRFISQLRERPDLRHDKRERERLLTVQQAHLYCRFTWQTSGNAH